MWLKARGTLAAMPVGATRAPTGRETASGLKLVASLDPVSPRQRIRSVDAAVGADRGAVQDRMILEVFDISLQRDPIVGRNIGQADIRLGVGLPLLQKIADKLALR